MFKAILTAAALAALAVPALAAEVTGPRLIGSGENMEVVYPGGLPSNIVGGGLIAYYKGLNGDYIRVYGENPAPQQDLIPHLVGSGENMEVVYTPAR
jgi:hypothetical protein